MPVFLHSNDVDLNQMYSVDKKVFRKLKKKFLDEPISDIGQTLDGAKQYETLSGLLTKILSILSEIYNIETINPVASGISKKALDYWVQAFSNLMTTSETLLRFMQGLPSLREFTPNQYQGIVTIIQEIVSQNDSVASQVGNHPTFSKYMQNFQLVLDRLQGYVINQQMGFELELPKLPPSRDFNEPTESGISQVPSAFPFTPQKSPSSSSTMETPLVEDAFATPKTSKKQSKKPSKKSAERYGEDAPRLALDDIIAETPVTRSKTKKSK